MARPKKQIRFKYVDYTNRSGTTSWRVTGTRLSGERVRRNFATKLEAAQYITELEIEDEGRVEQRPLQRTSLSSEQLSDAEVAMDAAQGQSLAKILTHYDQLQKRANQKGGSLDDALAFFEQHYKQETEAVTIFNATNEFLQSRINVEAPTLRNYRSSLKLLLTPDPNRDVHLFTLSDLEKRLRQYPNQTTRKTHQRIFSIFFRWCQRHHYLIDNPCERLDKILPTLEQIVILPLEETKRLLSAALHYADAAAAPPLAIALFAGLRPSEIQDLKPSDISRDRIRVTGGKLRRSLKRSVPLTAPLKTWLKQYPFVGIPKGFDYKLKRIRKIANITTWCHDVLRHTSITYQAERDKNEALTAFNCGTSKRMMDQHYREVIDDEATIADFWSITPERVFAELPTPVISSAKGIKWPSKATLKKLVWQKPLVRIAEDLGVSNVSVRKRCVKLGINLPARGHWLK